MVPEGIRELLFGPLCRVGVMQEQPGGSISSNLPSHRNCCCCSCPHSGGSSSYDGTQEHQPGSSTSSNLPGQWLPDLQQQQQQQLEQQHYQYRYLQPQQPQQEAPFLVDVVIPPGVLPGQRLLVHAPDGSSCKATVP